MSAPPPYHSQPYPNAPYYPQQQNYGYSQPQGQFVHPGQGYNQPPQQPQVVYVERDHNNRSNNNCCLWALLACCCGCCLADCCD